MYLGNWAALHLAFYVRPFVAFFPRELQTSKKFKALQW